MKFVGLDLQADVVILRSSELKLDAVPCAGVTNHTADASCHLETSRSDQTQIDVNIPVVPASLSSTRLQELNVRYYPDKDLVDDLNTTGLPAVYSVAISTNMIIARSPCTALSISW